MMRQTGYRGRRALVLGATGFIGRWVARNLTAAGAELSLGVRDPAAAAELSRVYGIRGLVVPLDVEVPGAAGSVIAATRPDIVFNLAGYGVDPRERDESRLQRINTALVGELLEALSAPAPTGWTGLQLVHAGSALEYGEIGGDLEEASSPNPTTRYGVTKLAGTELLARAVATGSTRAVSARLFTVYGPGEHAGRLLPSLLQAADSEEVIPLTAGAQQRDFTYVEDVAQGLLRLGLLPALTYAVVNLATGKLYQVKDFVLEAARVLHIPADRLGFGLLPSRSEDMHHSAVRTARIRELLGWCPPTDLASGIRATAKFLRSAGSRTTAEGGPDGV